MKTARNGGRLVPRLLRDAASDAALQSRQPMEASQRRLASSHGAGTSKGEAGRHNFWEAPTNPGSWKANQRAWVALGGFGLGSYGLLGGWLTAKEADKPYMEKEAKGPTPPAATAEDRRSATVGDAVSAAIPGKEAASAMSNAPTATPSLRDDRRHGEPFGQETGVQGRKNNQK